MILFLSLPCHFGNLSGASLGDSRRRVRVDPRLSRINAIEPDVHRRLTLRRPWGSTDGATGDTSFTLPCVSRSVHKRFPQVLPFISGVTQHDKQHTPYDGNARCHPVRLHKNNVTKSHCTCFSEPMTSFLGCYSVSIEKTSGRGWRKRKWDAQ